MPKVFRQTSEVFGVFGTVVGMTAGSFDVSSNGHDVSR